MFCYRDDLLRGRPEGERVAHLGARGHRHHLGAGEALAAHQRLHPPVAAGVVELRHAGREQTVGLGALSTLIKRRGGRRSERRRSVSPAECPA